ncbi:hypothetical protein J132_08990 [Termitomyces sp. J132]|nr:hypothetical protein J132_08990 [Termitomyces sp. J132]
MFSELQTSFPTPLAFLEFTLTPPSDFSNPCPPISPTLGNSNTSLANPDGSLANSNAFSAAINTSLDSPKPLGPSPIISDPAAHHQLLLLVSLISLEHHNNPGIAHVLN